MRSDHKQRRTCVSLCVGEGKPRARVRIAPVPATDGGKGGDDSDGGEGEEGLDEAARIVKKREKALRKKNKRAQKCVCLILACVSLVLCGPSRLIWFDPIRSSYRVMMYMNARAHTRILYTHPRKPQGGGAGGGGGEGQGGGRQVRASVFIDCTCMYTDARFIMRDPSHPPPPSKHNQSTNQPSIHPTPSPRDVEMEALGRVLGPMGYRVLEVQADGHCLYRAVAHQVGGGWGERGGWGRAL